jgi:hydroxymethylbilane synthase
MNRRLHGSCQVPIAGFAQERDGTLHLIGLVGDATTGETMRAEMAGAPDASEALGVALAERLLDAGAGRLLHRA